MVVRAFGPRDRMHLLALRAAGKIGHIKRSAAIIRQIFRTSGDAEVTFQSGGRLRIPLSDIYWSRILAGWEHEPEVRSAIELARSLQPEAVLLDLGANIGYWGARFAGLLPVIAVEAVPPTYRLLRETGDLNGFLALNFAIWRESGRELRVTWDFTADPAASVTHEQGDQYATVPTITIDDLYATYGEGRPLIIKLDVEGAEIAALDGAPRVAAQALWLYEDHGTNVTKRLWDAGLATAHMTDGHPAVFRDLCELESVKAAAAIDRTARPRGVRAYNFAAFDLRGPFSSIVGICEHTLAD